MLIPFRFRIASHFIFGPALHVLVGFDGDGLKKVHYTGKIRQGFGCDSFCSANASLSSLLEGLHADLVDNEVHVDHNVHDSYYSSVVAALIRASTTSLPKDSSMETGEEIQAPSKNIIQTNSRCGSGHAVGLEPSRKSLW